MQPDGQRANDTPAASPARARWTRAEWVIVAALLLAALSTVWPAIAVFRSRQRIAMARHDVFALQRAIMRYHREYGAWPADAGGRNVDLRFGGRRPNAEVLRVLRAEAGPGNTDHEMNAQRMIFIEVEPYVRGYSGLDATGEFLDPWGTPYQIVLDTSYDNAAQVDNSVYGRVPGVGVLVWSLGPDRKSETRDDILSWKR